MDQPPDDGRSAPGEPIFGAMADLIFRPGPVTTWRIARNATAQCTMQARVTARNPSGFTGCRGWPDTSQIGAQPATLRDVVHTVMSHGLEHPSS